MKTLQIVFVCTAIISSGTCVKDEDEGRPYEFGFTIDGQQHRYEKRGVNGIIQGEFGFITADGIYHVTTYATDENGSFRILSMRNVRISDPLDGSGGTYSKKVPASEVQGAGNIQKPAAGLQVQKQPLPSSSTIKPTLAPIIQSTTNRTPRIFTTQPTIKPACAGCGYVTRPPPTQKPLIQTPLPSIGSNEVNPQDVSQQQYQSPNKPIQTFPQSSLPSQPTIFSGVGQTQPLPPEGPSSIGQAQFSQPALNQPSQSFSEVGQTQPSHPERPIQPSQPVPPSFPPQSEQQPSINIEPPAIKENYYPLQQPVSQNVPPTPLNNQVVPNVEVFDPRSGSTPSSPTIQNQFPVNTFGGSSVSSQPDLNIQIPDVNNKPSLADRVKIENGMILVPNNPPIKIQDKYPGMVDGLPQGIEEKDITDLLYKFNYTIGFHGHYEKGLRNGTKIGGYFVNGRDGISRVVTYVADELGYRPSFKLINLGLDSPLTPKEETEKTFGLKNFEFVWYPLN